MPSLHGRISLPDNLSEKQASDDLEVTRFNHEESLLQKARKKLMDLEIFTSWG